MKSSASHMVSGKIHLVLFPENGRLFQWPFHANPNGSSTHTDFHFFALLKKYAASLAIPKRELSRSLQTGHAFVPTLIVAAKKMIAEIERWGGAGDL